MSVHGAQTASASANLEYALVVRVAEQGRKDRSRGLGPIKGHGRRRLGHSPISIFLSSICPSTTASVMPVRSVISGDIGLAGWR